MTATGPKRTWRDIRYESVKRSRADMVVLRLVGRPRAGAQPGEMRRVRSDEQVDYIDYGARGRLAMTRAMPPRIAIDESDRRNVIASPSAMVPASAVMTGTLN
jgi:hypothetical protein